MPRRWRWTSGGLRAVLMGAVALSAGCDDDQGASADSGAADAGGLVDRGDAGCEAVGQTWRLPPAHSRSLAAGPDGFVLLIDELSLASRWLTFAIGDGEPVRFEEGVHGQAGFDFLFPAAVAGNGEAVIGFGTDEAIERIQVGRWDGATWTEAAEDVIEPLADGPVEPRAASAAISSDGRIAVAWTAPDAADEDGPPTLWLAREGPEGGFLPPEAVFTPADDVRRGPCHVALDDTGGVHVLGARSGEASVELIYRRRTPGGGWGPTVAFGPVAPATSDGVSTGLAVTASGEVFAAAMHGGSPLTGEGSATVLYRIADAVAREVAELPDVRMDVAGMAMGSLGDEVVIATAHAGDLVIRSDGPGSVEFFLCNADRCRFGGRASGAPDVLYGPVSLAVRGREVMLSWDELGQPDLRDIDGTQVRRFECP